MLSVCAKCEHLSRDRQTCNGASVAVALHERLGSGPTAGCPLGRWSAEVQRPRTLPVERVPDGYTPTPANAVKGECGC
jgi:hypothetical protein